LHTSFIKQRLIFHVGNVLEAPPRYPEGSNTNLQSRKKLLMTTHLKSCYEAKKSSLAPYWLAA
jgi:hypothetical protein